MVRGVCVSMSAKCWSKGGDSASCLGVLMEYKLAKVHWYQTNRCERSIFKEGFRFPLAHLA